jgi:trehalose 6-phosphate synthase/phosphatase
MNEALLVNPTDTGEVAEAILTALTMPPIEQRSRLSYMKKRLSDYNVVHWVNDFLQQLTNTKQEQEKLKVRVLDQGTQQKMVQSYSNANKRCILLDYDGTLVPLRKLPSMAVPDIDIIKILGQLAEDAANEVIVISGRDGTTLHKWLGALPLSLVAEHGACIRYKGGDWIEQVSLSPEWKEKIRPLLNLFVTRCVGSFMEEKQNTLAWHYRNTHPDLGFMRSRELLNSLLQLTINTPLQVIDGNKVLEIRVIGIDKGASARKVMDHFNPDFILCMGDDTTDEDMFRVLRENAFTIKIGRGNTAAAYTLLSQQDVYPMLTRFLQPALPEVQHYQ